MDIILQGQHDIQETVQSLDRVLHLFQERYSINGFSEIHLTLTLLDASGEEVELIDSETHQPYRIFQVYRKGYELKGRKGSPILHLVVDNTKK